MEKGIYVKDIVNNQEVNGYFLVVRKSVSFSKNNARYISVTLRDSSGTVEGRIWDRVDELEARFEKDDLVFLHSRATIYQEKLQLTITDIKKVQENITIEDMKAFFPETEKGIDTMKEEYKQIVSGIKNPYLRSLFAEIEKRSDVVRRFFFYPASLNVHHVSIGGLLEHSVTMAKMGKEVVNIIGGNMDIVLTGCLIHDIGKIEEIEVRGGFRYSDRGRLLGHIALGIDIVKGVVSQIPNFPDTLYNALLHIIISHHGLEEWGSPKKPMFIEALIVHYLDNLDAKVMGVKEYMRERMADERWTEYHRVYESRFYNISDRDSYEGER
ncbi:MAG: HD domain-containing protein [Desulfobacterota bacterium]|nr:HD domain-containing protein [Thermodesulfobacteriota bacterium]MDW8002405.1 HD domain-containing protein [Deltaproteobacteria bacterium]